MVNSSPQVPAALGCTPSEVQAMRNQKTLPDPFIICQRVAIGGEATSKDLKARTQVLIPTPDDPTQANP